MRRRYKFSVAWRSPDRFAARIPMMSLIETVAEYLNFYHAANALGVSQSSVSTRIRTLEDDLGIPSVRAPCARRAAHRSGPAFRGRHRRQHRPHPCRRPCASPGSFLDSLIAQYRKAHPGVAIEIAEGTASEVIFQLRADQLDIAFIAGAPDLPDCHTRRIWHEPLVAVLPAEHRLAEIDGATWDDLAGEAFLVRLGGAGLQAYDLIIQRMAGRWLDAPSILRRGVERCTLFQMVAQGMGCPSSHALRQYSA